MARLSVLQLDTNFPRIAGDVGCADTFNCDLEIIKVPNATVEKIVIGNSDAIELHPFKDAVAKTTGDLITTSCGFLAPLQDELAKATHKPFIASALDQLTKLRNTYSPQDLKIITFDAAKLGKLHLPKGCEEYETSIIGLSKNAHLRDVISSDLVTLDKDKAAADVCATLSENNLENTKAILLECTNFPPYKSNIRDICAVEIYDILSAIEDKLPGAVRPQYL